MNRDSVLTALARVVDPELHKDIVTLGWVKEPTIDGNTVVIDLAVPAPAMQHRDAIERAARQALAEAGAQQIQIRFPAGAANGGGAAGQGGQAAGKNLPQVKHVIAVGAGKGGVGKSTVAVNIAVGLQRRGLKVGLMDGDIYGPSLPTLLGIRGVMPKAQGPKILPHHVHGLHAITIGSLVKADEPLMWRGPMAHGAFKQLLVDNTLWPELDYLIVDMPPGTGDVQLTLCQLLGVTGAVVVATPQRVALDDAVRAIKAFQKLGAPILGMVENMAGDIFGRGGTENTANEMGLPFLGRLELYAALRENSDSGRPHANFEGDPTLKKSLETIVDHLLELVIQRDQDTGPTLEIV